MAERIVIWTEIAANQRKSVLEYWNKRNGSPIYSKKLIRTINSRLKGIQNNPGLYKESGLFDNRESAMGHFSIYYKIITNQIIVTSFWDNRQDPKKLLEILKEK